MPDLRLIPLILGMDDGIDAGASRRFKSFLGRIGQLLNNKCRRASFATYAMGLLSESERKSIEPIAARACAQPEQSDAVHQRLLHFVGCSDWSDREVRRAAARYVVKAMTAYNPVNSWIVDDTGFLKQGSHSVGVQRQYTGSAGKVTNCQVGVSLTVATASAHAPIDFELYLPESWTNDPERREEARIPEQVSFKPKWELALDTIERALEDDVPVGTVVADADYGDCAEFRRRLRCLGLDYAVGIHFPTTVWRLDTLDRRIGEPAQVQDLAMGVGRENFRRTTWREGTRHRLSSRFWMQRVVLARDDGVEPYEREAVWLLVEWPDGKPAPTKYWVATLPPQTSRRKLVHLVKERWRTEQVYLEMKEELGLDHFEGRRFPGWHHHVSVALCCYAFVVAERIRAFPPSASRTHAPRPHRRAA